MTNITETPSAKLPVKKKIWINIYFFAVTTLGAVAGAPLYIHHYGISAFEIALFLFFTTATALSITVGYHRLYAHGTYQAHPAVRALLLFFGAASFEQSAFKWASQHRDHHAFTDTERDPYNIKKGFFYAHMGWLIFWDQGINYENAKDLQKDKLVMHQHNYYILWAVGAGILLPLLIGALAGHLLGAFIFGVCLRITVVYHSTFFINSVCHMFGNSSYDAKITARDHWFVALLTFGEGYHNFHHRFPSDYRNGVRWYHWDPSKWVIALLGRAGLATNLKKISEFRIVEARLAGEKLLLAERLKNLDNPALLERIQDALHLHHGQLRSLLKTWESAHKERFEHSLNHAADLSGQMRLGAMEKLKAARKQFLETRKVWNSFLDRDPQLLSRELLSLAKAA